MMRRSFRKYMSLGKGKKKKEKDDFSQGSNSTGSSLDPKQQLAEAYAKFLQNEGVDEAWRKEFFQQVRILVIGRSGAGKTTLIRLMVGKEGPQGISEGVAGVQDINKEFLFSSEEEGVPLLIHDSNGMDVRGKERVDEIKEFLERHQKTDDFTEHIHIIWYVISAIDPRCVEDGDVMKIIGEFKIPLLLIMTHNDYEKAKVTDASLNKLLEGYGIPEEREAVKKLMVRVGNDGVTLGGYNELIIDETKRDTEGLRLVARRTQMLMDKRLRYTWVAAQAVDIDGKLDESAGLIAGYARKALLTALPRAIPFADPLKLSIIFFRVIVVMCQIWVVPQTLKEALKETLLLNEAGCRVLRRVGEDMVYVAGLAIAIGATVATGGVALPSVIVVLAASGVLSIGKAVPVLVKTFSLQVLGTILYVKSTQVASSKHRWNPAVSKEEYVKLCEEFAHNAVYQNMMEKFAKEDHSTFDIAVRKKKVKGIIKSKILETYRRLLRDRPNSLFSLLQLPMNAYDSDCDSSSILSQLGDDGDELFDELDELEYGNM
ncbi:hypothetical protein L7F22_004688 [Adiantum nelumboides]|nr:hypothetical protein [Adiantum nelumboides]